MKTKSATCTYVCVGWHPTSDILWARKAVIVYIQVRGYNSFADNMINLAYMYHLTNYNKLARTGEDYSFIL